MKNYSCQYIHYEPDECCKCLLLGYHFNCGSQQCKEAIANEDPNKMVYTFTLPCKSRG